MQSYLKTKPAGVQLLLFLGLATGIWFIITVIALFLSAQFTGMSLPEIANMEAWDSSNIGDKVFVLRTTQLAQFLGLFLIPCLLFAYFSDPEPLNYLGLREPSGNLYFILGIALLILAIPAVEYLGILNRKIPFSTEVQQWMQAREDEAARLLQFMLHRRTPVELLLNLIFIALFAGVGEELFFRGVLQRLFIRLFRSPMAGIVLTAILFSAIHMQFFGFLPRFVLGLLLGLTYWYSGSLWAAILAHFVYDATIVVLLYFYPQYADQSASLVQPSFLPITALVSAAVVGLLVWVMKKNSTARFEAVYANDFSQPSDKDFSY